MVCEQDWRLETPGFYKDNLPPGLALPLVFIRCCQLCPICSLVKLLPAANGAHSERGDKKRVHASGCSKASPFWPQIWGGTLQISRQHRRLGLWGPAVNLRLNPIAPNWLSEKVG